jgi:hypothetical protein
VKVSLPVQRHTKAKAHRYAGLKAENAHRGVHGAFGRARRLLSIQVTPQDTKDGFDLLGVEATPVDAEPVPIDQVGVHGASDLLLEQVERRLDDINLFL